MQLQVLEGPERYYIAIEHEANESLGKILFFDTKV